MSQKTQNRCTVLGVAQLFALLACGPETALDSALRESSSDLRVPSVSCNKEFDEATCLGLRPTCEPYYDNTNPCPACVEGPGCPPCPKIYLGCGEARVRIVPPPPVKDGGITIGGGTIDAGTTVSVCSAINSEKVCLLQPGCAPVYTMTQECRMSPAPGTDPSSGCQKVFSACVSVFPQK